MNSANSGLRRRDRADAGAERDRRKRLIYQQLDTVSSSIVVRMLQRCHMMRSPRCERRHYDPECRVVHSAQVVAELTVSPLR